MQSLPSTRLVTTTFVTKETSMKEKIHPKMVPSKIICDGQVVMETFSTKPEIHVDVWSGNHPFFTGQQRFIDTEGRVEKFQKRFGESYRQTKKRK
jgi:large subunit ribosomal protein L31